MIPSTGLSGRRASAGKSSIRCGPGTLAIFSEPLSFSRSEYRQAAGDFADSVDRPLMLA